MALENIFKKHFRLLALDLFDLYLTSNYYKTRFGSTLPFVEFTTLVLDLCSADVVDGHQQSPIVTNIPECPAITLIIFSPAFKQGMEFSSDSEGGPKMGPAGEQTEEEKEAIEAYMAYIENERGKMRSDFFEKI